MQTFSLFGIAWFADQPWRTIKKKINQTSSLVDYSNAITLHIAVTMASLYSEFERQSDPQLKLSKQTQALIGRR